MGLSSGSYTYGMPKLYLYNSSKFLRIWKLQKQIGAFSVPNPPASFRLYATRLVINLCGILEKVKERKKKGQQR